MQDKRLMKNDFIQFLVIFLSASSLFYLVALEKLQKKIVSGKITLKGIESLPNIQSLNYCLLALVLIFFLTLFSAVGYFELKKKSLKIKPYQSLSLEIERMNEKLAKRLSIWIICFSLFFIVFSSLLFENLLLRCYIIIAGVVFFTSHLYLIHLLTKVKVKEKYSETFVTNDNQDTKGEKMVYTQSERTEHKKNAKKIASLLGDNFSEIEKEALDLQTDHFKTYAQEGQKRLVEVLEKNNFSLAQLENQPTNKPEPSTVPQVTKEETHTNENY